METHLEKLVSEALKLTSNERAAFAQLLLASLGDSASDEDAWELEVERRVADVESGLTPAIAMADALAQVRASLK
jgi:putative addiction module component (TIGR02574 family)